MYTIQVDFLKSDTIVYGFVTSAGISKSGILNILYWRKIGFEIYGFTSDQVSINCYL